MGFQRDQRHTVRKTDVGAWEFQPYNILTTHNLIAASVTRPGRKRSYTQNDADDSRVKRTRLTEDLQQSVDRLSRPRTSSATGIDESFKVTCKIHVFLSFVAICWAVSGRM